MAKPLNLYQGGAPVTFSQMGQGVAEGVGKIGQLYAQGILSGSKDISDTISEYNKTNKSAAALKSFLDSLNDDESGVISAAKAMMENPEISNADKVRFGSDVVSRQIQNLFDLQKIKEQNKGRKDMQALRASGGGGGGGIVFNVPNLNQD
jgi:hypothetical protein